MPNPVEKPAGQPIRITVPETEGGTRLDKWLANTVPEISRSRIQALLSEHMIALDGRTIDDPSYRVKPGETYAVTIPEPVEPDPQPEPIALAIVHEDADLIVIDKPAGLVVHPAAGNWTGTLVNALLHHCGDSLSGIGGVKRPGIVHRLDKDTSGLMVVAKTDKAHHALAAQFEAHTVERAYRALVWGAPRPGRGRIVTRIGRSRTNRQKMAVLKEGGKEAITNYEVLKKFGDPANSIASLLRCQLETGRTHQIRVHMTSLGHPIVGDPAYGTAAARRKGLPLDLREMIGKLDRQALHAATLGFAHPSEGEFLRFESPLPPAISSLITAFEQM